MATMQKRLFNNLSETLQKKLNDLKKQYGPTLQFKLLNGKLFEQPIPGTTGAFEKKMVYNSAFELPCRDTIVDPETGLPVHLAVITDWDDNENPKYDTSKIIKGSDEGRFDLSLSNPADIRWIDFLLLSSFLRDNNTEGNPLVELIDSRKNAKKGIAKFNDKKNAIIAAGSMTDDQIKEFSAAIGWDETEHLEVLRNRVFEMSENSTDLFKDLFESGHVKYRAVLKRAITKGIVTYNVDAGTLAFAGNGETFATLDKNSQRLYLEQFGEWVLTHPNGQEVFKTLETLVNKKK